ncbi:VapE domain-containing protein [Pseudoalteromonas sp. D48-MNA-CIBAN-0056]|uniref:VapE domain-containing protein n=1 Tax=Pseudoalteromonas sp. D48-MNA-CIBAN-0056 TaxID=3140417 RepID=UPI00331DAE4D
MSLPAVNNIPVEVEKTAEKTPMLSPKFPDVKIGEDGKGRTLNTAENLKALGTFYGIEFGFNKMTFEAELVKGTQSLSDDFESVRSHLISAAAIHSLPKSAIDDHILAISRDNPFHPVKFYLDKGEWDGIERVSKVIKCLNAKDEQLADSIMKHWLVACIACIYEDIFRGKLVPVLQGGQSFRKTAFIERVASVLPHSFLEGAELNPDNKDSILSNIRSWIVELGELERTSKNSQGSLKAFITKSIDTVRPPYGRSDIKKPRQTCFIATVNDRDFLKDPTGSTRFAVLELERVIDMDTLNRLLGWTFDGTGAIKQTDPEQLHQFWLEVKKLYSDGYGWALSDETQEKALSVNDKFQDKGFAYNHIMDNYIAPESKIDLPQHIERPTCINNWFTAGELIAEDRKFQSNHSAVVGKALKLLTNEGFLKRKKGRANSTAYKIILQVTPAANDSYDDGLEDYF